MKNNQEIKPLLLIEDLGRFYPTENSKQKKRYGLYKCFCGNEFRTGTYDVKCGNTKSCGCYLPNYGTHNLRGHRLYNTWAHMKQRTTNKKNKDYVNYGARGIKVCEDWFNDFVSFYNWAINNGYSDDLTIDRIDNDGNYEPSNCRWATIEVQNNNNRLLRSTNKTGYAGVSFTKSKGLFTACVRFKGKSKYLGDFKEAIDAAKAYNNFIIENNIEKKLNPI